jgi:hypothetical protein
MVEKDRAVVSLTLPMLTGQMLINAALNTYAKFAINFNDYF